MYIKHYDNLANSYAEGLSSFFNEYVHASDEISISREDDLAIQALWQNSKSSEINSVPCDLVAANMVPLPNVKIIVDERGHSISFGDGSGHMAGLRISFEVLIYPQKVIDLQKDIFGREDIEVGVVKTFHNQKEILFPFYMRIGVDSFLGSNCIVVNGKTYYSDGSNLDKMFRQNFASMLSTWYGIQIALLNPQVKKCFRGFGKNEEQKKRSKNHYEKRKTKYVRKIFVQRGSICKQIDNHRKRHTLSWYVIGHWRHYKNGKTIFINGYWKGILKDLKQNVDDGRNRLIDAKKEMEIAND